MITSSGQRVNLTHLCSRQTSSKSQPTSVSRPTGSRSTETDLTSAKSQSKPNGDYLAHEGRGGYEDKRTGVSQDYYYEVWAKSGNNRYDLKVWEFDNYPKGSPFRTVSFNSVGEAINYFDCNYSRKSLSSCPKG